MASLMFSELVWKIPTLVRNFAYSSLYSCSDYKHTENL